MTALAHPTHADLASSLKQFHRECVNTDVCDTGLARELAQLSTAPPEDFIVLKDGSRARVGKHTLRDGSACVLKYYYPKNLAKKINYALRGSRSMRSWVAARAFELLGIPTATPMMIHETKGALGLTLKQSFLACHLAPGTPLSHVTNEAVLEQVAPQLKQAFAIMAHYRISHGDLKANNIIVAPDHQIRFIDLDGTTILSKQKTWRQLWTKDRNRFLRNWPEDSSIQRVFAACMHSS